METKTVTQRTTAVDSLTKIQRLSGLIEAREIINREIAQIEAMFGGSVLYQPTFSQSPELPLPDGVTRVDFNAPVVGPPMQITPAAPVPRKKRKLTVEARKKIADAQKRRWAAVKKGNSAK